MFFIEMFGYIGSVLVAVSLMMSSIVRLRWINLVGAAIFSSYGFLIQAWPVAALNGFIVLIDVYHLWRISKTQAATISTTAEFSASHPYISTILAMQWHELSTLESDQNVRVTFAGKNPTHVEVVT